MEQQNYHPIPQPDEIPIREREDAMGAYFMMFASLAGGIPFPLINLIASFIYYFLNKSKSRFVHFHSHQSLTSQIPVSVLNAIAIVWGILLIVNNFHITRDFITYLIAIGIVNLVYFIFSIIAAVKARKGKFYYFIFFGKWAYHVAYKIKDQKLSSENINKPPKGF
ncbi:MAG: DUF4870 domain-containing protein [Ignavibacteriales bacterium]|nr:DUF4870 domain-containing protein [Ignavibacteriales bacterium]